MIVKIRVVRSDAVKSTSSNCFILIISLECLQDVRDDLDDKLDIAKQQFGDEIQLAKNKIVQKVNEI